MKNLLIDLGKFIILVYTAIIVCFLRALLWALPIRLVWNNIICALGDFNTMTYTQSYWITFTAMAFISAVVGTKPSIKH